MTTSLLKGPLNPWHPAHYNCTRGRGAEAQRGAMISYPITIIVRHPKENPKKCSVLPLKGRADLRFLGYPVKDPPALEGYVRLAAEGPPLSEADRGSGLLLLDGSWRWAGAMTAAFADVPPRSLAGYRSAYPRRSKQGTDPDNGLASV